MPDYYATLQVDPGADLEVIEVAYRRLARKWHPDTSADPRAGTRMQQLNEAYEVLHDPVRRRAYDGARMSGDLASAGAASRLALSLVVAVIGLLASFVVIRLLGPLARVLFLLALFCAVAYWFGRSLHRPR